MGGDAELSRGSERRELIGDFELSLIVRYGALPIEKAEASLRLFAAAVLPELHRW